jgi:hypothetical protein
MTTRVSKELDSIGDWVLIGTQEASNSASLTQTGMDSTYDIFCVVCSSIRPDASEGALKIRMGDSSGIDSGTSDYQTLKQLVQEGDTSYAQANFTSNMINGMDTAGNAAGESSSFIAWIMNPGDAGTRPTWFCTFVDYSSNPELRGGTQVGMREAAIVLDRIQVFMSSGNIESGRLTVWGLSHE